MTKDGLKKWRLSMGWSRKTAAKRLGISYSSFGHYECGTRLLPTTVFLATRALTATKDKTTDEQSKSIN